MGLKINESLIDSTVASESIRVDIDRLQQIENDFSAELSSEDLFRIDSAILASLRSVNDFSQNLLKELEQNHFEMISAPPKTFEDEMKKVQQNVMVDLTFPLQEMFKSMEDYIVDELQGV